MQSKVSFVWFLTGFINLKLAFSWSVEAAGEHSSVLWHHIQGMKQACLKTLPEERNCCPYYYSTSIKITLQWVYVPFSVCKKNIREIFNISIISCVLEKCSMWKHGEEPSTFDQLSVDHQHVFCKSSLIHRPQFENHCHGMWRTVLPGN